MHREFPSTLIIGAHPFVTRHVAAKASVKHLTVVDESQLCLEFAQQQHQQQQQQQQQQSWIRCDTSSLSPLPPSSFDLVLSCMCPPLPPPPTILTLNHTQHHTSHATSHVTRNITHVTPCLMHLHWDNDVLATFKSVHRLLKPDGVFVTCMQSMRAHTRTHTRTQALTIACTHARARHTHTHTHTNTHTHNTHTHTGLFLACMLAGPDTIHELRHRCSTPSAAALNPCC